MIAANRIYSLVILTLQACIGTTILAQTPDAKTSLRIRFDAVHSHTWIESMPQPGINQYHLLASPSRAAQALVSMGCQVDVQLTPWNTDSLRDIDLIVLNLVSADRPAFLISEIHAITDYVRNGGGMILITDHTNCYFHNHVLEPLCDQLDLTLSSHTACEQPPRTLAQGSGWILVESFGDHPIVRNVEQVGLQTAGTVDNRFGVAWTSNFAWADLGRVPMYGEGKDMAFTGNFHKDPDETSGPLSVVAAKEFDKGRIVVFGDQNAIGGFFLNYADNRRLWLQSAFWAAGLSKDDTQERVAQALRGETDRTLIWCVEPLSDHDYYWGSTDLDDFYHAFALLNKHADARATPNDLMEADWMLIPTDRMLLNAKWQAKARRFIEQENKHVVVFLSDPQSNADALTLELLAGLKHTVIESDLGRTYSLENLTTIHTWKNTKRWSNRQLLGPEATRNDTDYRWEEALLSPMWELGLKRVQSFEASVNWPEE